MARKFKLNPDPTFKKSVDITVPGKGPQPVEFTFKYRDIEALAALLETIGTYKTDADLVLDIASGWELEDSFDAENVATLCTKYAGVAASILHTYLYEVSGGQIRLGNFAP